MRKTAQRELEAGTCRLEVTLGLMGFIWSSLGSGRTLQSAPPLQTPGGIPTWGTSHLSQALIFFHICFVVISFGGPGV